MPAPEKRVEEILPTYFDAFENAPPLAETPVEHLDAFYKYMFNHDVRQKELRASSLSSADGLPCMLQRHEFAISSGTSFMSPGTRSQQHRKHRLAWTRKDLSDPVRS